MGEIRHSVWIDAAPNRVWEVFTDLDQIPEWQTGDPQVVDVNGPGDHAGTTYGVRRGPGLARTTVVEADPPAHYASHTDAYLGLRFDMIADLVPENGGTRLDIRAVTQWPRGLGLLGRLVELAILSRREGNTELNNLKALVERDVAQTGAQAESAAEDAPLG